MKYQLNGYNLSFLNITYYISLNDIIVNSIIYNINLK